MKGLVLIRASSPSKCGAQWVVATFSSPSSSTVSLTIVYLVFEEHFLVSGVMKKGLKVIAAIIAAAEVLAHTGVLPPAVAPISRAAAAAVEAIGAGAQPAPLPEA